jgi:hypothetical protein
MKVYTQEDNLLIQIYLTTAFLVELKNNDFLNSDYFKNVPFEDKFVKTSLPTVGIDNQGALLMMLYSMLVVPKQLLEKDFPVEFEALNEIVNKLKSNAVSTYSKDSVKIDFIRHIRNAVAHARVEFNPNISVKFIDENNGGEKCEITIPLPNIGLFLSELQKVFMKYIDNLKIKMK